MSKNGNICTTTLTHFGTNLHNYFDQFSVLYLINLPSFPLLYTTTLTFFPLPYSTTLTFFLLPHTTTLIHNYSEPTLRIPTLLDQAKDKALAAAALAIHAIMRLTSSPGCKSSVITSIIPLRASLS